MLLDIVENSPQSFRNCVKTSSELERTGNYSGAPTPQTTDGHARRFSMRM
ncbi:hypothetical protein HMPREF0281_01711 [Corynebacterium ammoniagenes DSM 20306]|uniref:Uncharacterized protein n=1 Tax=Corynebacterium ammoniagenes DSM 20306 TaxID=649754 RepID=A0ABN0AE51_CORAM|nr:hypothetical protein HMPREF0281_01711 [Corynebacterium ammoniagenes DSM 20306]